MSYYDERAAGLALEYERLDPGVLYAWALDLLPASPGVVLDVGAGTCRDAAWFAGRGFDVIAVEPSRGMRDQAARRHAHPRIRLLSDALPSLAGCQRLGVAADVVLVSGVWQHVAPGDHARAFRKLVSTVRSGGLLLFALRMGPDDGRGAYVTDPEAVEVLARNHGLQVIRKIASEDALGRGEVRWIHLALRVPDDGTGALPLLRHLILVDQKSSTYKLGLLRALCRAADGSAGLAEPDGEEHVVLPLGLVALNWLLLYLPLAKADLPQTPANRRAAEELGFAGEGWRALTGGLLSAKDLRIGAAFQEERSIVLRSALRDAADLIRDMPATYLTFSDGRRIFEVQRTRRPRTAMGFELNREGLRSFGTIRIPRHLWDAMKRFSAWIEPALVAEWSRLMCDYAASQGRSLDRDALAAALTWSDPHRTVAIVRNLATIRFERGLPVFCVWSGRRLDAQRIDIDHCFPWAAWPCGDLWNLLPADRQVNQRQKRDRLPTAEALQKACDGIMAWWRNAYLAQGLAGRFTAEAAASLPGLFDWSDRAQLEEVVAAMQLQRLRLRHDQGVPEWPGV